MEYITTKSDHRSCCYWLKDPNPERLLKGAQLGKATGLHKAVEVNQVRKQMLGCYVTELILIQKRRKGTNK